MPGFNGDFASVSVDDFASETRAYTHRATQKLRDNLPQQVTYCEEAGQMIARSGDMAFDALFALAMSEVRQNSVEEITDAAFNQGKPVACHGFETGAKWHYVWTRDTAYAVELALAMVSPLRSMNSLLFKLSERRVAAGAHVCAGPEIVQDTGSGGSWPVSTDRVVWALAAHELLKYLNGDARARFFAAAYPAIITTVENDRAAIFDPRDGLYRGEQSFLDWREQTYPSWTKSEVAHIGMSKSLSTNAAHCAILAIAAELSAEQGDAEREGRYRAWADALKTAINRKFWLQECGLYSSITTTEFDQAALKKFDLLGESLAVLLGIADETQAAAIVANYPQSPAGAPVIWPQQPNAPIYHNRAIWPFVSAYGLRAARRARNDAAVNHAIESLMRLAAMNLSNMENAEFVTGLPEFADERRPDLFGPVVNSQRQLWSVAGYLSMVLDVVFGREATQTGIRFRPFLTKRLRNGRFKESDRIELRRLDYKGKIINIALELPPRDDEQAGFYDVAGVRLNGQSVAPERFFSAAELGAENQVVIILKSAESAPSSVNIIQIGDSADIRNPQAFAPDEPTLTAIREENGLLRLEFDGNGAAGVCFNIFRNGERVASRVTGNAWTDPHSGDFAARLYFYAVEAEYLSSGLCSHHSKPRCYQAERGMVDIGVSDARARAIPAKTLVDAHGRAHFADWGKPEDRLHISPFTPTCGGTHFLSVLYANAVGAIETGITAAVKYVTVTETASGRQVGAGVIFMPHLTSWDVWGESSVLPVELTAGTAYAIEIEDFYNMSYFAHFALYTHGKGGADGAYNAASIAALRVRSQEM